MRNGRWSSLSYRRSVVAKDVRPATTAWWSTASCGTSAVRRPGVRCRAAAESGTVCIVATVDGSKPASGRLWPTCSRRCWAVVATVIADAPNIRACGAGPRQCREQRRGTFPEDRWLLSCGVGANDSRQVVADLMSHYRVYRRRRPPLEMRFGSPRARGEGLLVYDISVNRTATERETATQPCGVAFSLPNLRQVAIDSAPRSGYALP